MKLLLIFNAGFGLLVVLVTAFVFWRRLHKELPEEYLLRLILITMLASVICGRIVWWLSSIMETGWKIQWWWQIMSHSGIELVGIVLGGGGVIKYWVESKYKHILGEIGDAYIEAVGWGVGLMSLGNVVLRRPSLVDVGRVMLAIMVLVSWYWLKSRYRRFGWYSSGKVGFLWLAGLGLLSVSQLMGEWMGNGRLVGVVYNGLLLVISIGGIYTISGRNFGRDARGMRKRFVKNDKITT